MLFHDNFTVHAKRNIQAYTGESEQEKYVTMLPWWRNLKRGLVIKTGYSYGMIQPGIDLDLTAINPLRKGKISREKKIGDNICHK